MAEARESPLDSDQGGSVRRGVVRLLAVAVVAVEAAIPFVVMPRLQQCCLPPSVDWTLAWVLLALAVPAAVVVGYTAITWIIDGFAGAPSLPPTAEKLNSSEAGVRNPSAPAPPRDGSPWRWLWPDVSTVAGRRKALLYGLIGIAFIAAWHLLMVAGYYEMAKDAAVQSGQEFREGFIRFMLGEGPVRLQTQMTAAALVMLALAYAFPRSMFGFAVLWATVQLVATLLLTDSALVIGLSLPSIALTFQGFRVAYAGPGLAARYPGQRS
jgi:hypothetical protein